MRMPNSEQISNEQKDIYQHAPSHGAVLIQGPPGTGKTVIAFLRAESLSNEEKKPAVIMFNRVLKEYTSNVPEDEMENANKISISTKDSWFIEFFNKIKNELEIIPSGNKKIYLPSCSFNQKEKVKALKGDNGRPGGGWDKYNKCWYVWENVYESNKELLKPMRSPKLKNFGDVMPRAGDQDNNGSYRDIDWDGIWKEFTESIKKDPENLKNLHWGHLIIDEGQDLDEKCYQLLDKIKEIGFYDLDEEKKPAITVFADENQRLYPNNSSIQEIKDSLAINENHNFFTLTTNYRNTMQIAKLAEEFYTGIGEKPKKPTNEGDIPVLWVKKTLDEHLEFIVRYCINRAHEEIGIIVNNDADRKKISNFLKNNDKLSDFNIQTYSYHDKNADKPYDLEFDKAKNICIFNKQSCKGLEFDTVFLPELQNFHNDDAAETSFKNDMYVMCSRARTALHLMVSNEDEEKSLDILDRLPKDESIMEVR